MKGHACSRPYTIGLCALAGRATSDKVTLGAYFVVAVINITLSSPTIIFIAYCQ